MQCTINSMEKRKKNVIQKREIKYICFTCFSGNATQVKTDKCDLKVIKATFN